MIKSFTFFLGLLMTFSVYAQDPTQDWLLENNRGNRYEGSLGRKVSGSIVRLVSLTAQKEAYEFKKEQNLQVHYYSPDSSSLKIRAEELDNTKFYLMMSKKSLKATEGWQKFTDWPVDEVLSKLPVNMNNLGILVEYNEKEGRNYLPAWVFHQNKIDTVENYSATFQLGRSISSGNYKIYNGETRSDENMLKKYRISKKNGGDPFSLLIPLNLLEEEGWYIMEVNVYEKGTLDLNTYSFSFYHKPQ